MTMDLWLKLLAIGCVFLDVGVFVQGNAGTPTPGLSPPGKPTAPPAPTHSPAGTQTSSHASTSQPESRSPAFSAGGPSAETPLNPRDNASQPDLPGTTSEQPPHLPHQADPQAPSKAPPLARTLAPGGNDTAGTPAEMVLSTFPAVTAVPPAAAPSPAHSSPTASPTRTSNSTTNSSGLALPPTSTQSPAASSFSTASTTIGDSLTPSHADTAPAPAWGALTEGPLL